MAILKSGKPLRVSIHHSAVAYKTGDLAELKQRASAHNNYHRANSELWNNTTPGEFGYRWIRYHYMISAKGDLLQVQDDKYVLYANGDGTGANSFNRTAINIMFEGNFSEQHPTEAMMKTAVELIRRIEKKYNIDPPVRGHNEVSGTGTGCPGANLGTSQGGWLKQLIANINDKSYPPPEDWRDEAVKLPEKTKYIANKATALFEIDSGKRVKEFAKGYEIEVDYKYGGYFLTAWSFDRKIKNGFKVADFDVVKPPTPPVAPEPTECEKEVERLKAELSELELTTEAQEGLISALMNSKGDLENQVKNLAAELELAEEILEGLQNEYDLLNEKYQESERQKKEAIRQYNELKKKCGEGQGTSLKLLFNRILQILGLVKK